jgi:phage tail protein X
MRPIMKKAILLCTLILLTISHTHARSLTKDDSLSSSTAQEVKTSGTRAAVALPPEKAKPARLNKFEKPPLIDGKLDDEAWQGATVFKDFYQINPGDNIEPSKPTIVMAGYDAKFLYFGFHCFDEPDKIRATIAKRDRVFGEDNVRLFLDTFNDQRKAYVLGFNPLGVQQDGILTEGGGTDFSVDIVMESKGMLTTDGYVIEVAIPFKSLRYEAGKDKLWGFHVWRNIDRFNDEIDSWMPISRDRSGMMNQAGHLTGLDGISTERTLELIPSLTLSETGKRFATLTSAALEANPGLTDPGRFVNQPLKFDPGLTARFGITPTVTLDLALNPDFAQVEADQTVVTANQRFPIFFEEKRPFFLEGIDIFRTPLSAVHTRAIVDPDLAVKLTGKRGRNTFGLLVASDNAPGNFNGDERLDPDNLRFLNKNAYIGVLRLKRDVGRENTIGILATTYNFIEKHNQLGGFDGRFRLNRQTTFEFQALGTTSRRFFFDPELDQSIYRTGNGFAYAYNLNNEGRHFGYGIAGVGRTRDYRADVGFTRRTNTNNHEGFVNYTTEPKPKANIVSWHFYSYLGGNFDWQGRMQNWSNETQFGTNMQRQSFIRVGYNWGYERVFEEEFGRRRTATRRGTFAGQDSERSAKLKNVFAYGATSPSKKYSIFMFTGYRWGALDFDFGAGPKFPRVSPSALRAREAQEQGLCDTETTPEVCEGLLDPGAGNLLEMNASLGFKPTNSLNAALDFTKNRLTRRDTGRLAFDDNILALHATYQFTRFTFARVRVDYDSLDSNVRGQFLLGWTPNPGTSFYVGYNDDLNRNGFSPFTSQIEPGFRRNGRTFFIKMSYLFRRSF